MCDHKEELLKEVQSLQLLAKGGATSTGRLNESGSEQADWKMWLR